MARSLDIKTAGRKVGTFVKKLFWDGFGPQKPKVTVATGESTEPEEPTLTRKQRRFFRMLHLEGRRDHIRRVTRSKVRNRSRTNSRKRRRDRVKNEHIRAAEANIGRVINVESKSQYKRLKAQGAPLPDLCDLDRIIEPS